MGFREGMGLTRIKTEQGRGAAHKTPMKDAGRGGTSKGDHLCTRKGSERVRPTILQKGSGRGGTHKTQNGSERGGPTRVKNESGRGGASKGPPPPRNRL